MSSGVLLRHTLDRLNSLRQLVEPAQVEGIRLPPEEYADLINLVLEFPDSYRRTVDAEFRRLFTERSRSVTELQQVRGELANMADRYTTMVQSVEQDPALRTLSVQPHIQARLARLREAVATLQRDKNRVLADWPVCDEDELAQASIEREQGRFVPVLESFAQMRGISVEELQRRLEVHQGTLRERRL